MMIIILSGRIHSWPLCFNEDTLVGRSLYEVAESLFHSIKHEIETEIIRIR